MVLGILAINLIWFKPSFIWEFYERTFLCFALDSPEILLSLWLLELLGIRGHNEELNNASLYAEQLAFEKDLYTNLGRLRVELFRAVRLGAGAGR